MYLSPVERNYLEATLTEYYIPKYPQSGLDFPSIDGKDNYIWSLFTDEATVDFEGDLDKYDVVSRTLTYSNDVRFKDPDPTAQIKIILPEGIKDVLSVTGGDTIKLGKFCQIYKYIKLLC